MNPLTANDFIAGLLELAPRLGLTLIHSLWQGAAIAVVLAILLRKVQSSTGRYAASCAAMLGFAIAAGITFLLLPTPAPAPRPFSPVIQVQLPITPVQATSARLAPLAPLAPPIHRRSFDPIQFAGFAWLTGAVFVACWHLLGWLWMRRFLRRDLQPNLQQGIPLHLQDMLARLCARLGIRRSIRFMESALLNVPCVIGVFRPVILLPLGLLNELSPDQIEAILIHELAHIRRHDYLVNLLQVVLESLLFYHPATWWISAQIRRERENCCDDIAAGRFTPRQYASALLALEQRRWPMPGALVAADGGSLLMRVQRLLGRRTSDPRRPLRSALAAIVVLGCILVPVVFVGCDKSKSSSTGGTATSATNSMTNSAATSAAAAVANDKTLSAITADDLKPDYAVSNIGPNDLLEVSINDLIGQGVQSKVTCRVSDPDGTITVPLIAPIKVSGITDARAQQIISKAYHDVQIISNAVVVVNRIEVRSATFTVLGSGVETPGEFAITNPEFRLTLALASANARLDGQTSILVVRKTGDSTTKRLRIPSPS